MVEVHNAPAPRGERHVTLQFIPGLNTRLNAAAGITVFAPNSNRVESLAKAIGARDRFYFTGSPTATFTAPRTLSEVMVNFAYCPATAADCLIDEIRVQLPPLAR